MTWLHTALAELPGPDADAGAQVRERAADILRPAGALARFDVRKLARFDAKRVDALMQNAGLVRHRGKLESVALNARAFLAIQEEFGSFAQWLWAHVDDKPVVRRSRRPQPTTPPTCVDRTSVDGSPTTPARDWPAMAPSAPTSRWWSVTACRRPPCTSRSRRCCPS